jgi:hypothetical protein
MVIVGPYASVNTLDNQWKSKMKTKPLPIARTYVEQIYSPSRQTLTILLTFWIASQTKNLHIEHQAHRAFHIQESNQQNHPSKIHLELDKKIGFSIRAE